MGYNRKFADPGETVANSPCLINGISQVENMEQYKLMEPDTATISYIGKDGKMYEMYYDFKYQRYGESTQGGKDIHQWSDSKICSLLPKPDLRAVILSYDYDASFFFFGYGVSREEFQAYIEACKVKGFANGRFFGDNLFTASNAEGYKVTLTYKAVDETMTGSILKK